MSVSLLVQVNIDLKGVFMNALVDSNKLQPLRHLSMELAALLMLPRLKQPQSQEAR